MLSVMYMYRADLEPDASPLYSILGLLAARRHVKPDPPAVPRPLGAVEEVRLPLPFRTSLRPDVLPASTKAAMGVKGEHASGSRRRCKLAW